MDSIIIYGVVGLVVTVVILVLVGVPITSEVYIVCFFGLVSFGLIMWFTSWKAKHNSNLTSSKPTFDLKIPRKEAIALAIGLVGLIGGGMLVIFVMTMR